VLLAARQDAAEVVNNPERAASLERALTDTIRDLRETTLRLHPAPLRELGFERSVVRVAELVADRHQIRVDLAISHCPAPAVEEIAYSAVVELLANVGKHAEASLVTISTHEREGRFAIVVTDDGRGFDQDDRSAALANGHVGLAALHERVRDRGGAINFSAVNPGSRVTVWFPT
jgi:two-component system NarL family sensor kinase